MSNDSFDEYIDQAFETLTQQLVELKLISTSHKEFITEAKKDHSEAQLSEFDDISIRHELHTLITISALDLLAILKLFKSSTALWERIFLLKKGYLTIYETVLVYEKNRSKIRDLIVSFSKDGKNEKFDEINADLKLFKKLFDFKQIGKIRNEVSGHIDDDFDNYYDTVMSINPEIAINAINSLLSFLNKCDKRQRLKYLKERNINN